jgi:hypothetical protein
LHRYLYATSNKTALKSNAKGKPTVTVIPEHVSLLELLQPHQSAAVLEGEKVIIESIEEDDLERTGVAGNDPWHIVLCVEALAMVRTLTPLTD